MRESPLIQAILNLHLRLDVEAMTAPERRNACDDVAELMGREEVICYSRNQQAWLVAKAWTKAAGRKKTNARHCGTRRLSSSEQIRAILRIY